jgi:hypothetical protein
VKKPRQKVQKSRIPEFKSREEKVPRYPDLESVRGAAGKLKRPMSWKKIKEIIRNERAEKVIQVLNRSHGK